jgi:hypothetical protein
VMWLSNPSRLNLYHHEVALSAMEGLPCFFLRFGSNLSQVKTTGISSLNLIFEQ